MCRNIRVLHHFEPPTTPEEIRAAAVQYVRKVSGLREPTKRDSREAAAFEGAIAAVEEATATLLAALTPRGTPRTREGERLKGKARWEARAARIKRA